MMFYIALVYLAAFTGGIVYALFEDGGKA